MTIQRETITIEYGKTYSKDFNSVKMTIKETYLVSAEVNFSTKDFTIMKATEFENIIDEKIAHIVDPEAEAQKTVAQHVESKTIQGKYPQTARTEPQPAFRIDKKGQEKYECPRCKKMDRLKQYDFCYSCNLEL